MIIAISVSDSGKISHYGCSKGFTIYEINNKQLISKKTIMNSGIKGREIGDLLEFYKVNKVIVKGIGENAKQNLKQHNIEVIIESNENIDQIIKNYYNNI